MDDLDPVNSKLPSFYMFAESLTFTSCLARPLTFAALRI